MNHRGPGQKIEFIWEFKICLKFQGSRLWEITSNPVTLVPHYPDPYIQVALRIFTYFEQRTWLNQGSSSLTIYTHTCTCDYLGLFLLFEIIHIFFLILKHCIHRLLPLIYTLLTSSCSDSIAHCAMACGIS